MEKLTKNFKVGDSVVFVGDENSLLATNLANKIGGFAFETGDKKYIEVEYDKYGHKKFYWTPTIDLENGVIINWPKGVKVHVFYKVCDDFECTVYDEYDNEVLHYEGYVPDFMAIEEEGYGDYIDMIIDENGCIKDWDITSSDIQPLMEDY